MASSAGLIPFRAYETWYQTFGDLKSGGRRPLVVLHGGPGVTHQYLRSLRDLSTLHGIPVIFYDQIGCGKSTHLREKGADFWTVDFFLDELNNVLTHFDIKDDYDLLGHSWGAMLGAEHAVKQPRGLKHLVLADTAADNVAWDAEMEMLLAGLPQAVQDTLRKHERDGTTDSPEYQDAMQVFYAKHLCRLNPLPDDMRKTFEAMQDDSTVYNVMCGPSEFHITGTLKTWTIVDRLHQIKATTLVINGKYDEATDRLVAPLVEKIPVVKWRRFEESSHMPHLEERDTYMKVVGDFLTQ